MIRTLLVLVLLGVVAAPAAAKTNEEILNQMAGLVIAKHIRPGYQRLLARSEALDKTFTQFCAAPSQQGLNTTRLAFQNIVAGFAMIEHIHFGPVTERYRRERFFYWPDRKGRGSRAIRRVLNTEDKSVLKSQDLSKKSVALQGLGALELILYGKEATLLLTDEGAAKFRCAYGLAIAANLKTIAGETLAGWDQNTKIVKEMLAPSADAARYRARKEVVQEIYQAIITGFQMMVDLNVTPVLRTEMKKARPKRSAFWRSGLAVHYMRAKFQSLMQLVKVSGFTELLPKGSVDLGAHVNRVADEIERSLTGLETLGGVEASSEASGQAPQRGKGILVVRSSEDAWGLFELIGKRLDHLRAGMARQFAVAADLPLGFNASDGD